MSKHSRSLDSLFQLTEVVSNDSSNESDIKQTDFTGELEEELETLNMSKHYRSLDTHSQLTEGDSNDSSDESDIKQTDFTGELEEELETLNMSKHYRSLDTHSQLTERDSNDSSDESDIKQAAYCTGEWEEEMYDIDHDDIVLRGKEQVDQFILESVSKCVKLQNVKKEIATDILRSDLDSREDVYVEKHFIKCCFDSLIAEVEHALIEKIKLIAQDPCGFTSHLKEIRNFNQIVDVFSELPHYAFIKDLMDGNLIDRSQEKELVTLYKHSCWKSLQESVPSLKNEMLFVEGLIEYLKDKFIDDEPPFDNLLMLPSYVVDILQCDQFRASQKLAQHTLSSHEDDFLKYTLFSHKDDLLTFVLDYFKNNELNKGLLNLAQQIDSRSSMFADSVQAVLNDFIKPPSVSHVVEKKRHILQCTQKYANFKDIADKISHFDESSYEEIRIYSHEILVVNQSIKWPGKNVVIVTKQMTITEDTEWDVSGVDGVGDYSDNKAADGATSGEDGKAGVHGSHGTNGGNVAIVADSIFNSEKLKIVSNGGDGTDGQNGGDGKDGTNGVDGFGLEQSEFKKRFPEVSTFSGYKHHQAINESLKHIKNKSTHEYNSCSAYYTGHTEEGNKVIFAYQDMNLVSVLISLVGYPARQSYCFVKGTDGTPGQRGGDGGQGGKPGSGGYAGSIHIQPSCDTRVEAFSGNTGRVGFDGKGGKGGKNGVCGADNSRIEPSQYRSERLMHGNLQLNYYSEDSSERAWCPYNEKYAQVKKHSSPATTYRESGIDGKNTMRVKQNQEQCLQNTPIMIEEVVDQFQASQTTMTTVVYHFQVSQRLAQHMEACNDLHIATDEKKSNMKSVHAVLVETDKNSGLPNYAQTSINIPNRLQITKSTIEISPMHEDTGNGDLNFLIHQCNKATMEEWFLSLKEVLKMLDNKRIGFSDVNKLKALIETMFENIKKVQLSKNDIEYLITYLKSSGLKSIVKQLVVDLELVLYYKYKLVLLQDILIYMKNKASEKLYKDKQEKHKKNITEAIVRENIATIFINTSIEILNTKDKVKDLKSFMARKEEHIVTEMNKIEDWMQTQNEHKLPIFDFGFTTLDDLKDEINANNNQHVDDNCQQNATEFIAECDESVSREKEEIISMISELAPNIQQVMLKLQYVPVDVVAIKSLVTVLSRKFEFEGMRISIDTLKWIITCCLDTQDYAFKDIFLLFTVNAQGNWLVKLVLLQLSAYIGLSIQEEMYFEKELMPFNNHKLLILLSHKLTTMHTEERITTKDIINVLELSQDLEIDRDVSANLQSSAIADWQYTLSWLKNVLEFKELSADVALSDDNVLEAAYCTAELANKYGNDVKDQLMNSIKQTKINKDLLLKTLNNFCKNVWSLNEKAIRIIDKYPCEKWKVELEKLNMSNSDRSLETLVQLMKEDSNNSTDETNINEVKGFMAHLTSIKKNKSNILTSERKIIANYKSEDVKKWREEFNQMSSQRENDVGPQEFNAMAKPVDGHEGPENRFKYLEMIAIVDQAIHITKGFHLRNTQLMSIILFLHNKERGMLHQVSTGEGKSLIIAALAIIKSLSGENVDIITSSPVLAIRDAKMHQDLFSLFDVSVGHNCSEVIEERKKVYIQVNSVVYGEIGAFQRDILLNEFYKEDVGIGSRRRGYIIVDEVDSMLLDKGQNVLYLSHCIPGMDALEPVNVYIWQFVHSKGLVGTEEDVRTVSNLMMNAMFGAIQIEQLNGIVKKHEIAEVWKLMLDKGIIDVHGKIKLKDEVMQEEYKLNELCELPRGTRLSILNMLKDTIRQGVLFNVPRYLEDFVELHLQDWIENAFQAKYMMQNDHYIIDIDRTDARCSMTSNIIIMERHRG